jgi:hypothetical protein
MRDLPKALYNPISVIGAALAGVSFGGILFLTFVDLLQPTTPPYIGIIAYVVLPVPLVVGLTLIFYGWIRERRRQRRGLRASRDAFTVDLNIPRQRTLLGIFSIAAMVFFLFTAYGSYRAFEWTESTEFCGETCHEVMEPEHTAYQNSPHARVACVDCHVGPGAGWYVQSKLSGAYQVYSVLANAYSQPIATPIKNLRPAQQTCEQCHWPSHFAGEKKYVNTYFKSDSANTAWTVALLMKIGGGDPSRGPAEGIHWHMNIGSEIVFVASDSLSQVIPWVMMRNKQTGEVTEYLASDAADSAGAYRQRASHRMDCIDCHNRPSHIYSPPVRIVDRSLALGRLSRELPAVKAASVGALVGEYTSREAAMDSIPILFEQYYRDNYPEVAAARGEAIRAAAEELKLQYGRNFFPYMKVSWKAYPNNIGHMTDMGCFRCHDDKHVSPGGKVISKNCNSCHTILYQGPGQVPPTYTTGGAEFVHPEDIGDAWKETNCNDCHTGQ